MTRNCAVKSCGHRQGSKIKDGCTFSKFPKDVDWCRRLIQAVGDHDLLGLSLKIISKDRFVCSCHFNNDDYSITKSKKQIKPSDVPVKFPSNIVPLNDDKILEFPPNTNRIIPRMPLNPNNCKLSFTRDGPLIPISDLAKLQDKPMILQQQRLTDDLSSQIPSFASSPLSPSKSQIAEKSPSRRFLMGLDNCSENNLNEKSNACLKRRWKSCNDTPTSSKQTEIEMWNKENMALETPPK
ncbi:hypothetical protein KQX54_013147 [Cotesia glomerata]|uniref:THAP-type domain-containing protein n=1 Tax=Cotesia glomerata TaxID=32391 RepID=A0AAV7I908_COTGL|nr:hypothetical protein KQX54_013147 [Cotesia glomerata]